MLNPGQGTLLEAQRVQKDPILVSLLGSWRSFSPQIVQLQLPINTQQAADLWESESTLTLNGARADHLASPASADLH